MATAQRWGMGKPNIAIDILCFQQKEVGGRGMRRALAVHLSKASSEKASGTVQRPVSPMAREPLSGTLLYTSRGVQGREGRLGCGRSWTEVGQRRGKPVSGGVWGRGREQLPSERKAGSRMLLAQN
ncbi:hypothetical protein HJG60_011719 [Phyllostomus discolor]|uniref:Uncharacterized protein n=1 Tax=Phyllostomus discolor TaxID=89673 RepID=A0A833ZWA1_9CHIR|nr:hypothetical protein HJG60_011719 [Phyllostomus discolor]